MSEQGAALQIANQELVKYIEKLKQKSLNLEDVIESEKCVRDAILCEIRKQNEKLDDVTTSLTLKEKKKDDIDKLVAQTEANLKTIVESSEILLNVVQKEVKLLKIDSK